MVWCSVVVWCVLLPDIFLLSIAHKVQEGVAALDTALDGNWTVH